MLKKGAPFYTMFAVGDYSLAPWKVVWREVSHRLDAAVAGSTDGKPTIPDHTLISVACETDEEAHYLCAALNSSPAGLAVQAYIVLHPDPHILERILVPRYDARDPVHQALSQLSALAHQAACQGDAEALTRIEQEVDRQAARLWGLDDAELREIQSSLRELAAGVE